MGIFQRIADFFRMIFSGFVDSAEDSVPLERRLAYDRVKRAENTKKQMGAAEDVGAAAEMMVQQLAEARIMSANVRHEAKSHLEAAAAAAKRGDTVTQQQEEVRASALAEELAQTEDEVAQLEGLVEEALHDKKEAISMVLEQARELETLARGDSRLVARARMTDMRRQQLELREQMMDLVPGDQSNMRARIQDQVVKDEVKFRARRDVVDAMWNQKRNMRADQTLTTTAAGSAKLEELKREVGYGNAPAAAAAPATAASDALEELKREVGYVADAAEKTAQTGTGGAGQP
jgi:hypothetical protein